VRKRIVELLESTDFTFTILLFSEYYSVFCFVESLMGPTVKGPPHPAPGRRVHLQCFACNVPEFSLFPISPELNEKPTFAAIHHPPLPPERFSRPPPVSTDIPTRPPPILRNWMQFFPQLSLQNDFPSFAPSFSPQELTFSRPRTVFGVRSF